VFGVALNENWKRSHLLSTKILLRECFLWLPMPRPPGCKILRGTEKSWRIRIGDYRLIYEIDDSAKA
jgi:mRNA-degrading endonuclease RelE of RelBE toxin-antitoxin system